MAIKKIWTIYEIGAADPLTEIEASSERSALDNTAAYYGVPRKKLYAVPGSLLTGKPARRSHAAVGAALRKPSGRELSKAAKKANEQIYDLVNNKYFQSIPNDDLFAIVKRAGFRFDPEEEEFLLVGRDGKASWQLHDEAGREVNHMLALQWHKMDKTGRYEVVAYVS
jgi:hypothetical protein